MCMLDRYETKLTFKGFAEKSNGFRTQQDLTFALKVWSTVKIRRTRVPQNAMVPVGRPRPYSIIILNMRFIPKASLTASFQITASSYIYLSDIYE